MILFLDDMCWASFHPKGWERDETIPPRRANATTELRFYRRPA